MKNIKQEHKYAHLAFLKLATNINLDRRCTKILSNPACDKYYIQSYTAGHDIFKTIVAAKIRYLIIQLHNEPGRQEEEALRT